MIPARIPINWLLILPNAAAASLPVNAETTPELSRFWNSNMATRPARAAVPSLSSDIPIATPIANSHAILSIRAPPALIMNRPSV